MKKIIWVILILLILLPVIAPTSVGAAGAGSISISTYDVQPGESFWFAIDGHGLTDVASLDLIVLYDSSVFAVEETQRGALLSGCLVSINTEQAGQISMSSISLDGIQGDGCLLFVKMRVAENAKPGNYAIRIALGNVFDTNLQPCSLMVTNGTINIEQPSQQENIYHLEAYFHSSNLKQGDQVDLTMNSVQADSFVTGNFLITYDPEVFRVDSVVLGIGLQGAEALSSVNTAVPGQIRITFASMKPTTSSEIANVTFTVITDRNVTTKVQVSGSNIFSEDLTPYTCTTYSCNTTILQNYRESKSYELVLEQGSSVLQVGKEATFIAKLSSNSLIAAADFQIKYDARALQCVDVQVVAPENGNIWIVVNEKYNAGEIRFSYVNMDGGNIEELPLIQITFIPTGESAQHPVIGTSGSGAVELDMWLIEIRNCSVGVCVYSFVEKVEPDCWNDGYTRYCCVYCGGEYYADVVPFTHAHTAVVSKPTCTEQGYTTHTCHCGDTYVDSYVNALGHEYGEWYGTKAPTCTVEGEQRHDCIRCDHFETQVIGAAGHDYVAVVTKPTCTEQGYTTHACACGDSYIDSYVDALGHTHTAVVTKPTCIEQGYTTHTCHCGDTYVDSYVNALGHKDDNKDHVCDNGCGVYQGTHADGADKDHLCDYGCGEIVSEHKYSAEVTAPTCTENGYTTHTCACGDCYIDSYVDATGHKDDNKDHVCDNGCGVYQGTHADGADKDHLCDYGCGEIVSEHKYSAEITAPTCTEKGYTTHTCACGDSYIDSYVDALGHAYGEWYETEAPTCTAEGEQRHDCIRCDHFETQVIEATGHDYVAVVTNPTCTENGYTTHTCACGDSYVDSHVDALGHEHTAVVTKPTCTERGYTTHTCHCGDTYVDSYVNALGHKDDNKDHVCDNGCGVYQGTHADGSDKDHLCDYGCGAIVSEHKYSSKVTAPTCIENGYTTHTCACGDSHIDSYVDVLGHEYGAWYETKAPTCTAEGEQRHDCIRCDHFETQAVEATGHDHVAVVTKPTCTKQGYTTYTCACGHSYKADTTNALGHSFTHYISDNNATTEADGTKTAICDRGCGAKDTVVDEGSQIIISEITSDVYQVTEDYISKIAVGTTVEQLLSNLKDREYVQVFKDGVQVDADKPLGTGMIVRLTVNGAVMQEVEVVVTGDTNGDGKISITDMVAIKSHVLQNSTLEGASAMAADTSGDGKISITDFIQIKAHILGKGDVTPVEHVELETKTVVYEAPEAKHVQEADVIETKVVEETAERAEITEEQAKISTEQTTIICSVCREFLVPGKATSLGLWNYHKERYV